MLNIPDHILPHYEAILKKKVMDVSRHAYLKKWLRYFLDFCNKYPVANSRSEQVRLFTEKLREKKQTVDQLKEAAYAVSLYFEILRMLDNETLTKQVHSGESSPQVVKPQTVEYASEADYAEKSVSPEWDKIIAGLAAEIKTRRYSRETLKAYAIWSRQFQKYLKNKSPNELSSADVREYLTYLAVKCHVAASTQNQAFNALLFLFRHVLKKDFGDFRDIPRAKRSKYIPVVLSRREIDVVLKHLEYPYDLVVKLLYGCGLRLFECLQLRVHNFNFDAGILTIQTGKGKKTGQRLSHRHSCLN